MAPSPNPEAEARRLLDGGFPQVILSGPPGTGKTRAALRVAAAILDKADVEALWVDSRFALVQFHPSYNYEDFVRGIRMKTVDGQVAYQTEDRVFAELAKRAAKPEHAGEKHVLVVDEINRANVSAVLGELIYGLEYRGQKIQTPYGVDDDNDAGLVIPKNLLLLGTMNTADRTIGQIDYAVRRRFAFVHCPPSREVAQSCGDNAVRFFDMTDAVFAHLSPDHDAEDVRIGHSYFLADGAELANKIIYQVVPILREYVKDGVLLQEAEDEINKIRRMAEEIVDKKSIEILPAQHSANALGPWFWEHRDSGVRSPRLPLGRMILDLVMDCARRFNCNSLDELREVFPDHLRAGYGVVQPFPSAKVEQYKRKKYFTYANERITLPNGDVAVVCNQWGATGPQEGPRFKKFHAHARGLGYKIRRDASGMTYCWVVNAGTSDGRSWHENRKFNFWSAGHGQQWADAAKRLGPGEVIFVYLNKNERTGANGGYVGAGIVVEKARPIGEFIINEGEHEGERLVDCVKTKFLTQHLDNPSMCEWAARVDWLDVRDHDKAVNPVKTYRGTVKRVINRDNIRALEEEFHVPTGDGEDD